MGFGDQDIYYRESKDKKFLSTFFFINLDIYYFVKTPSISRLVSETDIKERFIIDARLKKNNQKQCIKFKTKVCFLLLFERGKG